MADFYSDLLSSTPSGLTTHQHQAPLGADGGVVRYKRARFRFSGNQTSLDVIRLMKFNWQDRLIGLWLTVDDVSDLAFNIDIGLYEVGIKQNGGPYDAGWICPNLNPSVSFVDGIRQEIQYTYASLPQDEYERGLPIWATQSFATEPILGEIHLAAKLDGTPGGVTETTWEALYIANT